MPEQENQNIDVFSVGDVTTQHARDAIAILREFRSRLDEEIFEQRLKAAMDYGYHLIGAQSGQSVLGILGYRITQDVCWGKTLYIDDLNVKPNQRGSGIGKVLMDYIKTRATAFECDHIRLCSGRNRHDAHRFYAANGFDFFSHQFVQALTDR